MQESLQSFRLDPHTLTALYGRGLVEISVQRPSIEIAPPQTPPAATTEFRYLGGNAAGVLVLVNDPGAPFLNDRHLELLTRILNACGLSLGDIALVNTAGGEAIPAILARANAGKMISFDVPAPGLPPNPPPYLTRLGGKPWLQAPPLAVLETDRAMKAALWSGLVELFGLPAGTKTKHQ